MDTKDLIPYTNYLCLEPVKVEQVLVGDTGSLQTFGKVLAVGADVEHTEVGDYVAFELWDLKDFSKDEKKYYFVQEDKAICKLPVSWFVAP